MVKTTTGKKTHCYLRVVESYRSDGRVRQRVLWNMGKWERVRPGLTSLVKSLSRFSGEQFLTVREIKDRQVKEYGNILLLKHLWEGSGFKEILESSLGSKKADCIMVMVFHKLCQPATSLLSWLRRVHLPPAERLVKLGKGRLKERLLNSMESLGRQEWLKGRKDLSSGKSCVIEISPTSPGRKSATQVVTLPVIGNYLAVLPLRSNNPAFCKVYARKELKTLLHGLKDTKRTIIGRYSSLGREGVAFLDKESISYLALLRNVRKARRRHKKKYLTFESGGQRVCFRTNIARTINPHKARMAFKGLLETETAFCGANTLARSSLASFLGHGPPSASRREAYLKGYIFVSILAYFFVRMLRQGLLKQSALGGRLQPIEALDTLKEIRVVSNLLAGRRWDYLTGMTQDRRILLKAFGIKRPNHAFGKAVKRL